MVATSSSLDAIILGQYLRSTGWIRRGTFKEMADIWGRQEASSAAEVVVPISVELKDYAQRLNDAAKALAEFERRSVAEVVRDVILLRQHVVSVRVVAQDTEAGRIPLHDGVELVSKARDLFYAAAMAVYGKRRRFAAKPQKDAADYLDRLELAQTEVGSFIINVVAPAQDAPIRIDEVTLPGGFGGAVLQSMVSGIEALTRALDAAPGSDASVTLFDAAMMAGASANMCDALLGFAGESRHRDFEISIVATDGPLLQRYKRSYVFTRPYVQLLENASAYFKEDYVLPRRQVTGLIKKLQRVPSEDVGTITLDALVGDVTRSVSIQLGLDDYHQALVAHDALAMVSCDGDLHIRTRSTQLLNPTKFKVLGSAPDLFEHLIED